MTDQSDNQLRECVSAMMDNESSELELLRTTVALSEDAELRQTWHRYHLTSLAIKRQAPVVAQDLSEQIAFAITEEPELSVNLPVDLPVDGKASSKSVSGNGLFRKVAIAASVAAVTVIGVQQLQLGPENINNSTINTTTFVDTAIKHTDYLGPQFHLPSGFALPPVSVRTVSTAPLQMTQEPLSLDRSLQNYSDIDTHRQIQIYFQRMMVKYSRPGSLTYRVTTQDQDR